jgi:peptide/nickel transport system substrate-binding protein
LASYLVEVESVRALGPLTVEIRTRRPFAPLLAKLTPVFVVPRGAPPRITEPVGTGSYRLARNAERVVEMIPDPNDWRGGRGNAPMTFVVEPSPDERLRMLLAGEVDVASDLAESAVKVLRTVECCREVVRPGSAVEYLHLSALEPKFDDRRVREAVSLALDREGYIAEAHNGLGQPVGQLAVPGVFGYAPDLLAPRRDVGRSRALLAEAGLPDGLELVLEHRPGRRADILAAQLADAGIRVRLRESPWPDLYRRLRRGEVGFYFGGVVSPTAESSDVLDGYVHTSDEARGYGSSNHCRFSSVRADGLIEAASSSHDLMKRRELLQEAMRAVMQELRYVPVAGLYQVNGVRRGVDFEARVDLRLLGREIVRR